MRAGDPFRSATGLLEGRNPIRTPNWLTVK